MSFDVAGLRADFPIFETYPFDFYYLDSAATGQICRAAAQALLDYETKARANVKRSIYPLAEAASEAFAESRTAVARYLGAADPDEVIFTSGTTFGLNLLAHAFGQTLAEGDEIVLSTLEHHSNIVPWQLLAARRGVKIRAIPVTSEGRLDLDRLDEVLTGRTRAVSVTHVSNVTGAITDVPRIVEAAGAVGARVFLDGAQRAPHGPLDVQALGVDAYAVSGHKMFGATGAGALWMTPALAEQLPPFLGGGEMIQRVTFAGTEYADPPHRFEAGTPPIGPAIAMGAAATWLSGLDWRVIEQHELSLTARLLEGLERRGGIRVIGPGGLQQRVGVVAFEVEGAHAHDLTHLLGADGVCVRGGHHCAQPLMDAFDLTATTRASFGPYNVGGDVDALLDSLDDALRLLR